MAEQVLMMDEVLMMEEVLMTEEDLMIELSSMSGNHSGLDSVTSTMSGSLYSRSQVSR